MAVVDKPELPSPCFDTTVRASNMLKKIAVEDLRIGMHVQRLEGPWLRHPFWKTRFTLNDPADLQSLRGSGITELWIDIDLGCDVAPVPQPAGVAGPGVPEATAASAVQSASPAACAPAGGRTLDEELRQAASICERGREAVVALFHEARLGHAVDTAGCMPLVDDIAGSVLRNPSALVSLARLKRQDDYSYMHSVAVCALMVALGRQLGMAEEELRAAGAAGLLHDIGKAMIPLAILNKPGRLTAAEYAVIQHHPACGHRLLQEGQGASPEVLDVVLHHHERVDGAGYPHRLEAVALSRLARMGAICDVYDAITSDRPYKAGWDPAESIARMAGWKGQFDDKIFASFVQSLGIYPIGSVVELASRQLAVVIEQNPQCLTAPVVTIFFSMRSQLRVTPRRLDLGRPGCSDRIVGRAQQTAQHFGRLDELWAGAEAMQGRRGR